MSDQQQLPVLDRREQEAIGRAIALMIRECPIALGVSVIYEDIDTGAMGVFPTSGTAYLRRFISGTFIGRYAFQILYRVKPVSDEMKILEENRLESLACWLEGQTVTFKGRQYPGSSLPELSDERTVKSIQKTSHAMQVGILPDGSVDFQVYLQLEYQKRG